MPLNAGLELVQDTIDYLTQVSEANKPSFCDREMRQNFVHYRIFGEYLVHLVHGRLRFWCLVDSNTRNLFLFFHDPDGLVSKVEMSSLSLCACF
ncbi:hypothetical protein FUAX_10150 [Fulvitalea axinellae]|uniref:Uncharacterized protein n=1 Tax=Fulvitalea axinellae TaxID=1182444 RepID=A0AAU9CKP0_9BACT|nr:hypothetical protein FUAX_10150 [Fulvitalea axinellae]